MARKAGEKQDHVKESNTKLEPKPSGFKARTEPLVSRVTSRFGEGTRGFLTKPMWVPPDIEIAWALAPKEDNGENLTRRMREGFDVVPEDLVTDDLNEAISGGKICFPPETISKLGTIAQTSGVGLAGVGLVLLARRKEVGDNYRKALAERYRSKLRRAEHGEFVSEEQKRVSSEDEASRFINTN